MIIIDDPWPSSTVDDRHRSWMIIIDHGWSSIIRHDRSWIIIDHGSYYYVYIYTHIVFFIFQIFIKPSYFHPQELILRLHTTVWRVDIRSEFGSCIQNMVVLGCFMTVWTGFISIFDYFLKNIKTLSQNPDLIVLLWILTYSLSLVYPITEIHIYIYI